MLVVYEVDLMKKLKVFVDSQMYIYGLRMIDGLAKCMKPPSKMCGIECNQKFAVTKELSEHQERAELDKLQHDSMVKPF